MQEFYAKVNAQVRSSGRDPRACAILPSIEVIAGTSQAAADDRAALLDSFAMPEMAIGTIGRLIRRDLSKLSLDTLLSAIEPGRSAERRVGKECVSTCRSRWSPSH